MDELGYKLFFCPTLALDENGNIIMGRFLGQRDDLGRNKLGSGYSLIINHDRSVTFFCNSETGSPRTSLRN
jgi:hypothetical protein